LLGIILTETTNKKPKHIVIKSKLKKSLMKIFKYKNIPQYFEHIIFSNKKIDIKDAIFITGTPRSGTTWFMDIMMTIPDYTFVMEPIYIKWFPESYDVGFKSRTYLPIDKEWEKGEDYLRKIFTGKIVSRVPQSELKIEMIMRRLTGQKLVIKAIHMNRMLPWLEKRFEFRGIFLIIRHPCAVISSQLKSGFYGYYRSSPPYKAIPPTIDNVLEEASMIDGLDPSLLNKLRKIETTEEILAAAWCLDYYVPLSMPKPHPWTTVIYEKLAMDGEKEIRRLFNKIGEKNIPTSALKHLRKPSKVTLIREFKYVAKVDEQLSKWKKSLSEKQIERILRVVSDFGLDFYTDKVEPDYDNISINL
jgi:hypothetical protein